MPRFYETTLSITNLHNLSISTHVNRSRITFSDDSQAFHNRCKNIAHIRQLTKYNIVSWNPPSATIKMKWHKMSVSERQFICLMNAGFSNRELCAIFQVGKISSIYVKYHRIKAK